MHSVFDTTFSSYGKYLNSNVFLQKPKKNTHRSFHLPKTPDQPDISFNKIQRSKTPMKMTQIANQPAVAVLQEERPRTQGSSAFRSVTREKTRGFCHYFLKEASSEIKYSPKYDLISVKSPAFSIAKEHQSTKWQQNSQFNFYNNTQNHLNENSLNITATHNPQLKQKYQDNNNTSEKWSKQQIILKNASSFIIQNEDQLKGNQNIPESAPRRRMSVTQYLRLPADHQQQNINLSFKNIKLNLEVQNEKEKSQQSYSKTNTHYYKKSSSLFLKQPLENIQNITVNNNNNNKNGFESNKSKTIYQQEKEQKNQQVTPILKGEQVKVNFERQKRVNDKQYQGNTSGNQL